jgi:ectoine hydroxylase-related dioxygenase (phytanoyl-CoA dioxygenase family)
LTVVKAYLGEPILRNINAWHSVVPTSSSLDGNLAAAQLLHHDNDKPLGWVKVFIYLTDVWQDNGPHAYVPSSHKHVPDVLRRDGRYTDAEVIEHYPEIRTITGECGTIIIGDTQCLHKGTEPLTGQRSILQLEFCNSLLGAEDNNTHYKDGTLLECYKRYSFRMMSRYIKSDRIN